MKSCGATWLDEKFRPLCAYVSIRRPLFTESHAPSHILRNFPFPIALRSPFNLTFSAALSPSAARCGKRGKTYLLFLNGLLNNTTIFFPCQVTSQKIYKFIFPKIRQSGKSGIFAGTSGSFSLNISSSFAAFSVEISHHGPSPSLKNLLPNCI